MKKTVVSEVKGEQDHSILIDKENIVNLHFPKNEVLVTRDEILKRFHDLNQATISGNFRHSKVSILFEDIEGLKRIETTIWGVTDKQIILKNNIVLPIHRIVKTLFTRTK